MIVDAHTHVPADRRIWPEYFDACRKSGIDSVVTSCLGDTDDWPQYPSAVQVRKANEMSVDFCSQSDGLVKMLVYINPQNDNCLDEIDWGIANGAIGIKLWVALKDDDNSTLACYKILDRAAKLRMPVLIHACNKRMPLKGELTTLEVAHLAEKFPNTTIIEAHAGGCWHKDIELLKPLKNVYVDVSGFYPQRGITEGLITVLGAERVLWGSDAPLRTIASQLAKVVCADISESQKRMVLVENACKVYNLTVSGNKIEFADTAWGQVRRLLPIDYDSEYFCFCGQSPFEHGNVTIDTLALQLKRAGIKKAYTACFDSIFAQDAFENNEAFFAQALKYEMISPLPAVNPAGKVSNSQLAQITAAGCVFVSPYLTDKAVNSETYRTFFVQCAESNIKVFVNCDLGDYRFRPVGCEFHPVTAEEIADTAKTLPENDYVFQGLNAGAIRTILTSCLFAHRIKFDISRLTDFSGALKNITEEFGFDNLVWGSEYPLRGINTNRWVAQKLPEV